VNLFGNNTNFDKNAAQSLAAFEMAIDEINMSPYLLPRTHLIAAIRGNSGTYGAVLASQKLQNANFSTTVSSGLATSLFIDNNEIGVNAAISCGTNKEVESSSAVFNNFKTVQVLTSGKTSLPQ
jgi:hypothetical protein